MTVTGLIMLMVLSGFTEGLGVMMIYPLLSEMGVSQSAGENSLLAFFDSGFTAIGLDMNPVNLLAAICIIAVFQGAVALTQGWFSARSITNFVQDWRNEVLSAYLGAKWKFFVARRQGDLFYTLFTDTERCGGGFSMAIQLASTVIIATIYIGYSLLISWQATLILLSMACIIFMIGRPVIKSGGAIGSALSHHGAETHTLVNEFISGAKLIKATATEKTATDKFAQGLSKWNIAYFKVLFHPVVLRVVFETLGLIMLSSMFVFGVEALQIDMASILVVLALFLRLYPKLSGIQQNIHTLNITLPAYVRVTGLVAEALEQAETLDMRPLPENLSGKPVAVRLENVTAGYDAKEIIRGINIDISPGKTIAIVGESGAGKSTLVDCLVQLVDQMGGSVFINDVHLSDVSLTAWRKSVGYVAQDTFLFHASVRDNILWGAVTSDDVVAAAKKAGAHDFISAMPEGYETIVGDRGVKLSGGQRQRIGLARALCGQRQLLILDEATSALDSSTEKEVMDTIGSIHGEITIVIVAHRLSTVRSADYIYVLDKGSVFEEGTWDELISRGGIFAKLWNIQSSRNNASCEERQDG